MTRATHLKSPACGQSPGFTGNASQAAVCALEALYYDGPQSREDLDRAAKVSNGPEIVRQLRKLGLEIPCERVRCLNSYGTVVRRGVYSLTRRDAAKIRAFIAKSAK